MVRSLSFSESAIALVIQQRPSWWAYVLLTYTLTYTLLAFSGIELPAPSSYLAVVVVPLLTLPYGLLVLTAIGAVVLIRSRLYHRARPPLGRPSLGSPAQAGFVR